jgi:hypothetical protein
MLPRFRQKEATELLDDGHDSNSMLFCAWEATVFSLRICCLAMTRCYSARTSSARFMSASSSVAAPLRRARTSSRIRLLIRKPLAYQIATRRFKFWTNAAFLPGRYLLPVWVRVLTQLLNPANV